MKTWVYNFILFLSSVLVAQPLTVSTTVDRTELAVNQQLVFTIQLSGEAAQKVGQPDLPDMGGFLSFLGSGGTSQNISFVNGKMSVTKSFTFYYLAVKEGTFTIPPVQVEHQNTPYRSKAIQLTITKSSTPRQGTTTSQSQGTTNSGDLFIRTQISKKKVYQGEPILLTYQIYSAVSVSGYSITKLPETTGFWVEELETPQQPQVRQEVINGRPFVTADVRKIIAFATSPGEKTIGPIVLQCEVREQSRSRNRDIFDSFFDDGFFGRTVRRSVSSNPIDIEVMPLPTQNRPEGFSGAVGEYNLEASVDKTEVDTDEAITLKITISGIGNIRLLPKPKVIIPADFEQYEPKETERINRKDNTISGSKTFEYVLVPRFPGTQRIKPVTFSFFNPKTRQYETLTSPETVIQVAKGQEQFVRPGGSGLSKEEVRYVGRDIRFIKLQSDRFQPLGYRFYNSFPFLAILIVPLLLLGIAFLYKNHVDKLTGNEAYARSRKANAMAMRRLSRAKSLLHIDTQKEFYGEVSNALAGFAADKLNKSKAGLLSDELESEFKRHHIDSELTSDYFSLIRECDYRRFAPTGVTQEVMEQSYKQAKNVIIKLEKEF